MIGALVATAFWAMLPAYVPNNAAVLAGGGRPIDGGREWRGARLLGDGKTWRGTAVGTAVGVAVALALNRLAAPASTAALFGTYAGNIAQNAVATSEPIIPAPAPVAGL